VTPDKEMSKTGTVLRGIVGSAKTVKTLGYFKNTNNSYTKLSFLKDR
jgi:hypothetical protein